MTLPIAAHALEVGGIAASASLLGYVVSIVQKKLWPRSRRRHAHRAVLAAELLFFIALKLRLWHFNRGALAPKPPDERRAKALKERFLRKKSFLCLRSFLSDWHRGVEWGELRRGNVERFVALGYFEKEPEQLGEAQAQVVLEIVEALEATWEVKFPEGHSPHTELLPGYERLEVLHKPLAAYLLLEAGGWALAAFKLALGYRPVAEGGLTFWHWRGTSGSSSGSGGSSNGNGHQSGRPSAGAPLVFFHGLGAPFPPLLHNLQRVGGGRPVILLQAKHLSQNFKWRAPSADDVAHATATLLRRLGYTQACLMGHSYGTFYCARTCTLHPELVESVVLMDPVCLCTCLPKLAAASAAAPRWRGFPSLNFWTALFVWLARHDFSSGQAMRRLDRWHATQFWPEDLPRRTLVVICGADILLPVPEILDHLQHSGHPAKVLLEPSLGHGGMFFNAAFRRRVLAALHDFCQPQQEGPAPSTPA